MASSFFATIVAFPGSILLSILSMIGLASWPRQIVRVLPRAPASLATVTRESKIQVNRDAIGPEDRETSEGDATISSWIARNVPSLMGTFRPAWWLPNGHLQTMFSAVGDFTKVDRVLYERTYLRLPDGGTLGLDFTPKHFDTMPPETPFIVVCHGLTGGSHESYVRNVLTWVIKPKADGGLGGRAVVVNYRGCAGVALTSPQYYSAVTYLDLGQSLHYLRHTFPQAPLHGIGFSLGGAVLTNYLGFSSSSSLLSSGMAIGCPWNLPGMSLSLEGDWFHRLVYSGAMAQNLLRVFFKNFDQSPAIWARESEGWTPASTRSNSSSSSSTSHSEEKNGHSNGHSNGHGIHNDEVLLRQEKARDVFIDHCLPVLRRLKQRKWGVRLKDVDQVMVSRLGGPRAEGMWPFGSADDYYHYASPYQRVEGVKRPLLAINAFDDPIIDGSESFVSRYSPCHAMACYVRRSREWLADQVEYLPIEQVHASSHTYLAVTGAGGHLGWFNGPFFSRAGSKRRWILEPISEFLSAATRDLEIQGGPVRLQDPQSEIDSGRGLSLVREEDGHAVQGGGERGWRVLKEGETVVGAENSGVLQGL